MKKTIRLTALLGLGFLLGACTEDDIIKNYGPRDCVGDEIVFGVSTASDFKTRTVYGDASADEKKVEVNWIPGDMLMIACPQAAGTKLAHYQVTATQEADKNDGTVDRYSETTIGKADGETVSLQWGEGKGDNGAHDFYAVYPSFKKSGMSPTKNGDNPYVMMNDEGFVGYLPLDQSSNSVDEKGGNYIVNPNMDIAYMVANTPDVVRGNDVELAFSSLNTVLQFQIWRGDIEANITVGDIKIHGASLFSASGKAICGSFNYKFASKACTNTEEKPADYSRVTISLPEPKTLTGTNYCDFTFFVLPTYQNSDVILDDDNADYNDLQLQVMYSVGGSPQIKSATIKANITKSRKHLFKKVKLPAITQAVTGSNWFEGLADNILLSQVSIPVASNVFANATYFSGVDGIGAANYQQVKDYETLWDMGVRGFEFVNRRAVTFKDGGWFGEDGCNVNNNHSLSTANFVVDEVPLKGTGDNFTGGVITFGQAFNTLVGKLAANPQECLVVICTYQAVGDGYDPNGYVQQLLNYLDDYTATNGNTYKITKEDFVQIKAGATVEDLAGKIAIIIRPGDDDRYEKNSTTTSIVLSSNDGTNQNDWSGNVTLIHDWGTAFDVWDRRYKGVAREAQFETQYRAEHKPDSTQRPLMEDWLWGAGAGNSGTFVEYNHNGTTDAGNNAFDNFGNGEKPERLASFNYTHACTNNGIAYVQEWARVVPSKMEKHIYTGINHSGNNVTPIYLWVRWDESYSEKLKAIDGLFQLSVAEKGKQSNNLYINSLSGYYIDENIKEGLYPFKNSYAMRFYGRGGLGQTTQTWRSSSFSVSNMGKGGDHVGLAYELNKYVYGVLSGTVKMQDESYLPEGPWGLVMMEHIGNTAKGNDDKSVDLVNLIMMNNFKFPLATSGKTEPKTAEVSFSIDPANPSGEIY